MRYFSGEDVREGDVVKIKHAGHDQLGTVVMVIAPGSVEAETWSAPHGGVLIEGGGLGLSLTVSLEGDSDVVFVARRGADARPEKPRS